jgi:hypothetical protein
MPEALTNDSSNRAKLILNASGGSSGVSWSWTVTDGNPTFGGYGYSGAYLSVTVAGNVVENVSNQSYDFGGSTGSNTIVTNAYFPKAGRSNSGFIGLPPGDHLVSGTFYTTGNVGTATVSFYVNVPAPPPPPTPVWSTTSPLPTATRGTFYSTSVSASPVTSYSAIGSSGQTGGLSASGNVISGTPNTVGTASFTIRANNSGSIADRTFSFTINPALPSFSDSTVNSSARIGIAYSDGVSASETSSYSVVAAPNNLPPGLSLNTSTGAITGTPTTPGTYSFRIRATNVTGSTDTAVLTITAISAARVWNGTSFVSGLVNVWNGTSFVSGTIRVWNGSAWVNTN